MARLKGTRTGKNLLASFAGEMGHCNCASHGGVKESQESPSARPTFRPSAG